MEVLVYLICIVVASFAVLAQPTAAQGANTTPPPHLHWSSSTSKWQPDLPFQGTTRKSEEWSWQCNSETAPRVSSTPPASQLNWASLWWVWLETCCLPQHVWPLPAVSLCVAGVHQRSTGSGDCQGVSYSTGSEQYNLVCGRIIGYQFGSPESFYYSRGQSINSVYVEGISITNGSPRHTEGHCWEGSDMLR